MEATKAALIAVLGKLGPKDKFDVVSFNDLVHPYASGLVAATPLEVSNAQDWVRQLTPMYSTNIYDAMQHAFRLAGRGSFDKYYVAGVDTIFLLTDGAPTTPDGRLDSTDRVLEGVRQWNSTGRIVIHTIGIGKDINDVFLKKMAAENHGTFVQQ
jgi:Ca-activated chloride channel family protein